MKINIQRLPVGTTETTVAQGDHTHAVFSATSPGFVPPTGGVSGLVLSTDGSWVPRGVSGVSAPVLTFRFRESVLIPPPGRVAYDTLIQNNATAMFVSDTSDPGNDISPILETIRAQDYIILQESSGGSPATSVWRATGAAIDLGTYKRIPIEFVGNLNGDISNNALVQLLIVFAPKSRLPSGGLAGQVLMKVSNDDYDVAWVTP